MKSFSSLLDSYLSNLPETYVSQLLEWVSIPSISAMPEHDKDCVRMAEAAVQCMADYGFESRLVGTSGKPLAVGTLKTSPHQPWIMVYNHIDVQPAKEAQWKTDPFKPVFKEGVFYGRGTTDDKGPALSILHAIHFLHQHGLPLPNIQVVYETEEEIGSTHFGQFLDQNKNWLSRPDSILISDTIFEGDYPAITYKLKGMQRLAIELQSSEQDLHSGLFGGACENPLNQLILALGLCMNKEGEILVPGFMEGARTASPAEMIELRRAADVFDLQRFLQDCSHARLMSQDSAEILSRLWHRPTMEVHGFEGVQHEPGVLKSALPYKVRAKISLRLVPGQEPKRVVSAFQNFLSQIHSGIRVYDLGGQKAGFTDLSHPHMALAAKACQQGFGRPALFVGCGGTIGSIPQMQRVFPEVPVVLIAQSLMSDGYHAPNEQFRLEQAINGCRTITHYLHSLAAQ